MPFRPAALLFSATALAVLPADPGSAQDTGGTEHALRAFSEICLTNAASLGAARSTALSPAWGFASTGTLPSYNGAPGMETFAAGDLELVLRPNKNRFGCLLLPKLSETDLAALPAALGRLPGLTAKGKQSPGASRYKWSIAAPKGSEIVLTLNYGPDSKSAIIALESNGNPN